MATRKRKERVLVDRICEPDLIFHSELRRHKDSRCGIYRDVKKMTAAVQYMKDLKDLYPDLATEIWSIAPTSWYLIYSMKDDANREKALQIVLEYLRTGNIPIPLYDHDRDERYTLLFNDIKEIVRHAKGKPTTGSYNRHVRIYPKDAALLKQIVEIAIFEMRRAGNNADIIDRMVALQEKILGPKGR